MTPYSLPALIALTFKVMLLVYVIIKSPIKNQNTKLYFVLLSFLSAHNLVEVGILNYFHFYGLDSFLTKLGFAYFAFFIPALAILLHISLRLSFGLFERPGYHLILLYIPAATLEYLLLFTDKLVAGFIPFQYSILREAGTLYFLFETFAVLCMMGSLINLCLSGTRSELSMINRIRNRLWLLAIAPMALLTTYLIVCNHFGWTKLTSTFHIPLAATFFLVVTAYATHQYRLFDIQFYIPWSKVRQRKTAFYKRIQAMIAEIADLDSIGVERIVQRLADTLRCSVALVGGTKPVVAMAGGPRFAADIPQPVLQKIDHILVANEITDALPDIYRVLKNHGVAAVVPFHPHSRYACGWLLLGDSFSEQVYTPRDFKFVERLFDKMADVFLDKLLAMRTQLADASRQIRVLERRQETLQNDVAQLVKVNQSLIEENARLLQYQPADSLSMRAYPRAETLPATLTVLGRDKTLFRELRRAFPQVAHFVGTSSSGFKRQPGPDVLLCEIEEGSAAKLLQILNERADTAALLLGPGAAPWAAQYKQTLRGRLIEALPQGSTLELVERKVRALATLRNAVHSVLDHDQPLIGQSDPFVRLIAEAKRLATLADPVLIRTTDIQQATALAAFMYRLSGGIGGLHIIRAATILEAEAAGTVKWFEQKHGVLMVDDVSLLPEEIRAKLCAAVQKGSDIRFFGGCSAGPDTSVDALLAPLRPFVLTMPSLYERHTDLSLLIHYFTLQYNLQTGGARYLRQSEIDGLIAEQYPQDLVTLKHAVFSRLIARTSAAPESQDLRESSGDKTLDQHVAEFEARLIADTLKRCNGNKSQAARLLGLRPNTLHYKLERYALLTEKKD